MGQEHNEKMFLVHTNVGQLLSLVGSNCWFWYNFINKIQTETKLWFLELELKPGLKLDLVLELES
jgi:hypothetical protein